MFEKLLANLPYNPTLTKQLSFYARRMRREQAIRRTGMVFIVMAFMVQFFAFVSPPQPTTASSNNDMVPGGFSSKSQAVTACNSDVRQFKRVLANFGITCNDVSKTTMITFRSTDHNNQLFSFNWIPQGANNARTGKKTYETPYNLNGVAQTIYARKLSSFDSGAYSTYQVLAGKTASGVTFYIMLDCGNLTMIGLPPTVENCKYNNDLLATDPRCFEPCPVQGLQGIPKTSPQCVKPCPYNPSLKANDSRCFNPCPYNKNIPVGSSACFEPCPYNPSIPKANSACKPCEAATSSVNAVACIVQRKAASNQTQNIADANNTTANASDVIIYTLMAENKGKEKVKAFIVQENMSDVLDYADIIDLHGGTLDQNTGIVTWKAVDIAANSTLTQKITIRVKNPIPTNTSPTSDPMRYDYVMTNVYGNSITIRITPPPTVTVATTAQSLPETGPGSSIAIATAIVVVAGFFFARSRLLVDESMIAIQQTNAGNL